MNNFKSILRAFKYRNYRLFFTGQGISIFGTWMQSVAQGWLIYRLTNSPLMLGVTAFCGSLPSFFMAPIAGILCDRFDKRKIILIADIIQMAQAFLLAALVMTGTVRPWHIVALASVLGLAGGFEMTTRHSFIPEIIEKKDDLGNAIALNSALFNSARLVGPAAAGFIIAVAGEGICFLLNGISFAAIITALLMMDLKPFKQPKKPAKPLDDMAEGFRYVFGFKPLRELILLMAFISLTGGSAMVLLPVIAKDVLKGGPQTLGFLTGAFGAGALIAAIYLASRKSVPGLGRIIVRALVVYGAALCALAFSSAIFISIPLLMLVGTGTMLHMASTNTMLQTITDDDKRGRVISFYIMAFSGLGPVGNLITGWAAKVLGVKIAVLAGGLFTIAAAVVFMASLPKIRELLRPVYISKGILPSDSAMEPAGVVNKEPKMTNGK